MSTNEELKNETANGTKPVLGEGFSNNDIEPIDCPYCGSHLRDEHEECYTCLIKWSNAFSH
jgi:hypothetical protein